MKKLYGAAAEINERQSKRIASDQSEAHGERREPDQSAKTQRAENRGRAEILDLADIRMMLARDVVGQLLDRRVQQLDGEHDEERGEHGNIPSEARRDDVAGRQRQRQRDRLLAHGSFGRNAVDNSAPGILGRTVNTLHGVSLLAEFWLEKRVSCGMLSCGMGVC